MFGTGCIIRKNADNFSLLGDLKVILTSGKCLLKPAFPTERTNEMPKPPSILTLAKVALFIVLKMCVENNKIYLTNSLF